MKFLIQFCNFLYCKCNLYMNNYSIVVKAFLIFSFALTSNAQENFNTKEEYLNYVNEQFDILPEDIFYVSDSDFISVEQLSILMFFKGNSFTTLEKVTGNALCPPKRLIRQFDINDIESRLRASNSYEKIVFKNMMTGEDFIPKTDEIIAVYLFSYTLGKHALLYINQKDKIADKYNVKNVILSIDNIGVV